MSKRARWDGPGPVHVYDPEASVYDPPLATVEPGHHLPDDVPARIRKELVARDNWTEVEYTPPGGKTEKNEGADA